MSFLNNTIKLCNIFTDRFFSSITQKVYRKNILDFCFYIGKDYIEATRTDCEEYARYISDRVFGGYISTNTGYAKLSCLCSFGNFIKETIDEEFVNHFADITRPTHEFYLQDCDLPSYFDIRHILDAAANDKRLQAIFVLVIKYAFTTSDLIELKVKDILLDAKGCPYAVAIYRYSDKYVLEFDDETKAIISDYINNSCFHNQYFFNNDSFNPFSPRHLQKTVRKFMQNLFDEDTVYTLNMLRNASISIMYALGASNEMVAIITKMTLSSNMERYIRAKRIYFDVPESFLKLDIKQADRR